MPKPGPCPLPILSALPDLGDTTFYAKTDVPHGRVVQVTYKNHAGQDKRMHVYLPAPYYETNTAARYPVLYLNHGGGDDDSKWTSEDPRNGGHAQFILDNLIAAGKAKPLIIVMPNHGDGDEYLLAGPRRHLYAGVPEGYYSLCRQPLPLKASRRTGPWPVCRWADSWS